MDNGVISHCYKVGMVKFISKMKAVMFHRPCTFFFLFLFYQSVVILVGLQKLKVIYELRHDKTNKVSVRPAKTQISLGIRSV